MSNVFDRVRTVTEYNPEAFDEVVELALTVVKEGGATVVHVRFDTQIVRDVDEWGVDRDCIVYIAHILIRDRKPKPTTEGL